MSSIQKSQQYSPCIPSNKHVPNPNDLEPTYPIPAHTYGMSTHPDLIFTKPRQEKATTLAFQMTLMGCIPR